MPRPLRRGLFAPQAVYPSRLSNLLLLLALLLSGARAASAQAQSSELVQYPSEEVAFIAGPQLKSGSAANPFPWFDRIQVEHGHTLGRAFPAIAPRVLTGTVTVRQGSLDVDGVGTRFTSEVDPSGVAPFFNGWLRVKMPDGAYREARVASVVSDTRMVLTAAWPFAGAAGAQADTNHFDAASSSWNYDRYYDSAYYDMALVQYLNYYRTGDERFLTYARKVADSWWASPYIGHGSVTGGPNSLPPRSMAYAGLMLRALDGRPEMWDYLHRQARSAFDNWVLRRLQDPTLYYDLREDGYSQLYAVLLARVLPDSYDLYPNGTLVTPSGRATDGAVKRAELLRDTGRGAVEFFGRLQRADGSWRWDVPGMGLVNVEQPFMVGLYLESVVALDQITTDPVVKASLRSQLERACRHLFEQAYRGSETTPDMPQYRWRGMWYFWGGGTTQNPSAYANGEGERLTGGDTGMIRQVRHLNSTVHHAFGYAYAVTGDEEYLRMGEEVFDASYGERVDGIRAQADTGRGKDYAMNYRASGRFLAWRLAGLPQPTPTPTPIPTPEATPTPTPTPEPTPVATPTPTPQGRAKGALARARREAQDISNELNGSAVAPTQTSGALMSTDIITRISEVVTAIQQTYGEFSAERTLYPAAARAEGALTLALEHAARANNLASQGQTSQVKASLQLAIDYLELADVLLTHGDVENPIDYSQFLVRQHYVDFLGREPDEAGRNYWAQKINECGPSLACVEARRIDVSAAYFLSIEFRETGYVVYRLYRGTLGRAVLFSEFLEDAREVGKGLAVGAPGWAETLAANKRAFYQAWVQREDFRARYGSMNAEQFVTAIFNTMGVAAPAAEYDARVAELRAGAPRADVLAKMIEGEEFSRQELNRAFVQMQYFGYLRRDPDEGGFNHWLKKLEDHGGNYRRAEMVKAFLSSIEYRERFRRL